MKLTEKQKLLKRLNAFCAMLGDQLKELDADLLVRLEETKTRLASTSKVAVAGLGDSQHRSLAEFLLGATLFRNAEEAKKCPTIQVRYAKEAKTHAIFGETRKTYPGVALSLALAGKAPDVIGLEITNPIAADIAFTILPVYEGDDNRAGYLVNLLDDTASIVWCSKATETWHPRERRLWFTVPDTLKERSILALTNAENLTDPVVRTVYEEKRAFVSDEFCHLSPIFIDDAKSASSNGSVTDAAKFKSSGGETLLKQIMSVVQSQQTDLLEEARALRVELDKIPLGSAQPVPSSPLPFAAPASPKDAAATEDRVKKMILDGATACKTALDECASNDFTPVFDPMSDLLSGIQKAIRDEVSLERDHTEMIAQADEASELVGLLSYENNAKAAEEAALIILQIVNDVWSRLPGNVVADTQEFERLSAAS